MLYGESENTKYRTGHYRIKVTLKVRLEHVVKLFFAWFLTDHITYGPGLLNNPTARLVLRIGEPTYCTLTISIPGACLSNV